MSTVLKEAFHRYRKRMVKHSYPAESEHSVAMKTDIMAGLDNRHSIKRVAVYVTSSYQSLGLQTSETYTLRVSAPTTIIHATNVFGALRGLETLAQMTTAVDLGSIGGSDYGEEEAYFDSAPKKFGRYDDGFLDIAHHDRSRRRKPLLIINESAIYDTPRFRHRGLLIDTARHFLPLDTIKTHLDAMEMAKLNVLHWHIVDDQSFPYSSDQLPELAQSGAFDGSAIYSTNDIQEIVAYARARGIRVIPEFDTPGHTASWGRSHPELLTTCYDSHEAPLDVPGPLDVSQEATYTMLWQLIREAAHRFSDAFVHLGGDEVATDCWKSNSEVRDWMKDQGMGRDYSQLQPYHTRRMLRLAAAAGKDAILWQEAADPQSIKGLPASVVVQVWKWAEILDRNVNGPKQGKDTLSYYWSFPQWVIGQFTSWSSSRRGGNDILTKQLSKGEDDYWLAELKRVTSTHRALLSAPWYLNIDGGGSRAWERYWSIEPLAFSGSGEQKDRVIGGEACVWGELVDATNAIQKTWPLAASIAERLWSDEGVRDVDDAYRRLQAFRCRLLARGIRAAPVGPGFCHPDVELDQ
jgi:hexosaminidase